MPARTPLQLTNLQKRVLTAFTLGPLVLAMVVAGGWWFFGLVLVLALVGTLEFCGLGRNRGIEAHPVIAIGAVIAVFYGIVQGSAALVVAGFVGALMLSVALSTARGRGLRQSLIDGLMACAAPAYVALPSGLFVLIRAADNGLVWLLLVLCITWGTDVFAYFGGRQWGKTLLAPRISPKKTVEGALIGYLGGLLVSALLLMSTGSLTALTGAFILFGPAAAIIGDLGESALKRAFNVKDSHLSNFNLFPGHGGVLDRTDSLILVTWFCYAGYVLIGIL